MDSFRQNTVFDDMHLVNRFESLLVATGGFAHDFSNLMMLIAGYIDLAKRKSADPCLRDILSEAEMVCQRATDLTKRLSEISENEALEYHPFSLRDLSISIVNMLAPGASVDIVLDMENDVIVVANRTQISQVLLNLIINAIQAMRNGGTITIRTEHVAVEDEQDIPLQQGRYAKVSVRDEGMGIPKRLIPRIFDYRFSTKQNGSGLGLAIAAMIVNAHGGHISVETEENIGSTFSFYLPVQQ